jgi:hypothetical protein
MDRYLDMLLQTEIDPSRTNDVKPAEAFRLFKNFICSVLDPYLCDLSKGQLYRFILVLKKYYNTQLSRVDQKDMIVLDEQ